LDVVVCGSVALAALLLIAGLWTPVAGAVVAVVAISDILRTGELLNGRLQAATIGAALMMHRTRSLVDRLAGSWVEAHRYPRAHPFALSLTETDIEPSRVLRGLATNTLSSRPRRLPSVVATP
jgi:hypothetical protein